MKVIWVFIIGICLCGLKTEGAGYIDLEANYLQQKSSFPVPRVSGKFGNAWDFYNSRVPVILGRGYGLSNDFTLDVWVKMSDRSGTSFIFSSHAWSNFGVLIKAGKLLYIKSRSFVYFCEYDFVPGRWYHLAITYGKQQGFRAYINGRIVIADQSDKKKWNKNIVLKVIGAHSINGKGAFSHYFKGLIDRPRFRAQYLDSSKIEKLYREGIEKLAIVPIPQQVFAGKGEPFKVSQNACICLNTNLLSKDDPGIVELTGQLAKSGTVILKKSFTPVRGIPSIILWKVDNRNIPKHLRSMLEKDLPKDGFMVSVRKDRIDLVAGNSRGLFYAIQCVSQLLQHPEISPVDIYDYPEFPYRACLYVNDNKPPSKLNYNLRQLIQSLAKYRINYVMLRIHDWVKLNQPEVAASVRQIADYAKKYHVEVIPYLQCYGHAKAFLWKDLRCAHTVTVEDETVVLGADPVVLSRKNVIITKNTPVEVRDTDGTLLTEGSDYELIAGDLKTDWVSPKGHSFKWWWAKPYICEDNKPWKIKRLESGRIKSGQKVFVTYDVASNGEGYCPFSEYTRRILGESIANTVKLLDPDYINLGMDEIWQPRGKGRCCGNNKMNAGQTIAYEMDIACKQAKEIKPQLKVLMFGDMLDERQTPSWKTTFDTSAIINGTIDKHAIMMPWYYGYDISTKLYIEQSTQWFLSNGYDVIGTAGVAPINMFLWGQYLSTLRGRYNTEGFTYTMWAASKKYPSLIGLAAYSQNSWSPARLPLVSTVKLRFKLDQMGIKAKSSDDQIIEMVKQKQSQNSPELKQLWITQQTSLQTLLNASVRELKEMNFEKIKGIKIEGLDEIISAINQTRLIIQAHSSSKGVQN